MSNKKHYRAVFISDVHLGSRGSQAELLLELLKSHTCDHLYLVGDIIDLWALKRRIFFPQAHVDVVRRIMKIASQGVPVTYIIGNHDDALRNLIPLTIGNVTLDDEYIHRAADGRRYLVIHGDQFDQVVRHAKWVALLGDVAYDLLMRSNHIVNFVRRKFNLCHWSLSAYLKARVKQAVNFVGSYEDAVVKAIKDKAVDGVICGHIHTPAIKVMDGYYYINTGDWVESITAVVEDEHGEMRIVRFSPSLPDTVRG